MPQSYSESLKWDREAADQGYVDAQVSLGFMYSSGQGVPQDYTEAAKWFRLAADQGNAGAQFMLGNMYAVGRGVSQDYVHAHMWLNLAAAHGENKAEHLRDLAATKMTEAQIAEAQKLTREWKPTKHQAR